MKKTISILGSTGSIGRQTVDVIEKSPGAYRVLALAGGRNVALMEKQIRALGPRMVCMTDPAAAADLAVKTADLPVKILAGTEGLEPLIEGEIADIYAISLSGMMALKPVLCAIKTGARIALANKESIVTAGEIMFRALEKSGAELIPVDSEHSAVFQCLQGEESAALRRIWLTASGGPFRGKKREALAAVTPEQALRHPNWSMGAKITIDSASLANKGLEVMEAHYLFSASYDQIQVVIHPQSVIHSMVEFSDGAVKAQLGTPDMRLPIQYALGYPRRGESLSQGLDFSALGGLSFEAPDLETFPALSLAYEAGRRGGTLPTVFNAANELAVARFLKGELPFLAIPELIQGAMARHRVLEDPSLEDILDTEQWVKENI